MRTTHFSVHLPPFMIKNRSLLKTHVPWLRLSWPMDNLDQPRLLFNGPMHLLTTMMGKLMLPTKMWVRDHEIVARGQSAMVPLVVGLPQKIRCQWHPAAQKRAAASCIVGAECRITQSGRASHTQEGVEHRLKARSVVLPICDEWVQRNARILSTLQLCKEISQKFSVRV